MGKYLMIWELNPSLIPIDMKERGSAYQLLTSLVKQDFEKGILKDWGSFIGEGAGFCILEGTELECMNIVQQYIPYVAFTTHAIGSFDQTEEMIKSMIT